ncbi:hypothetical protein RJ639_043511 [Escallonia herrerae]|uniref:C2 domain-containing protein n=1 Tax=Escallonia herrerae TaxID=1293975 RepID=A0AA89AZR1_9ASTE|nr:hypothetical protein RJ639_043511 [Escallonia herrerae]
MTQKIPLEITLISADIFENANTLTRMRVYTAVSIVGDPFSKSTTPVDEKSGRKPFWCYKLKFHVKESEDVLFQVRCRQILGRGKDIGFVHVPVKDLLDNAAGGSQKYPQHVAYPISSRSGKANGVLYLSYMFDTETAVTGCALPPSAPPCPTASAPYFTYEDPNPCFSVPCFSKEGCFPVRPTPSGPYFNAEECFPPKPLPSAPPYP